MERLFTLGLANAAAATALAVLVALLVRCLRGRPAVVHCLWLLVLLKLVTPPLFEIALPRGTQPEPVPRVASIRVPRSTSDRMTTVTRLEAVVVQDVAESAESGGSPRWTTYLGMTWLLGSAAVLLLAVVRIVRFQRILALTEPADNRVQEQVDRLAASLGLRSAPTVWMIDAALTPLVWAAGREPRLYLPRTLWKSLDARRRTLLLTHELAHIKRGDHLVRPFELAVTVCFWWLPTVWWARQRLRDAEEECCDAWVVWAFPEDARAYAETLLETVEFLDHSRSGVPLLASGFGRAHHLSLQRRLTMIMLGTTPRKLGLGATIGAFGLAGCLLPLSPSWAQKPADVTTSQTITIEVNDDDAKPDKSAKAKVNVHVVTDGEVADIKEESVSKAVETIRKKIESLQNETDGTAEHRAAHIDALKQALRGLENSRTDVVTTKEAKLTLDLLPTVEKDVLILRGVPSNPEAKAKIEKARARIAAIQSDLVRKQKELAEAQRELEKASVVEHELLFKADHPRIDVLTKPTGQKQLRLLKQLKAHPQGQQVEVVSPSLLGPTHQDHRLDALEKKLAKLLDEVAAIKNQQKGDRAK